MAGKEPVSKNLSASNIRYLLTLRELEAKALSKREGSRRENFHPENAPGTICVKNAGVRYIDLSNALGISRASAHNMIDTFINAGLVGKNTYGTLFLTVEGNDVASRYGRYLSLIHIFVVNNNYMVRGNLIKCRRLAHGVAGQVHHGLRLQEKCSDIDI